MRVLNKFRSGSSLDRKAFNRRILDVLTGGNKDQERIIAGLLQTGGANDNRMQAIKKGRNELSLGEIAEIIEALEQKGLKIDPDRMGRNTPFAQKAFYESLRHSVNGQAILEDLQRIRDESKRQKGFLSTAFSIFSDERPLEKIADNVVAFEDYCYRNGITFDDVRKQLVAGDKPQGWMKRNKFLLAAAGGTVAGLAGFDPATIPVLSKVPGFFFTVLPFFAVPFIGLNTFKAFSQRKISEELGTLLRFSGIMAIGVGIGFGASSLMSGTLGSLDMGGAVEQAKVAVANGGPLLSGLDAAVNNVIGWAGQYTPGAAIMQIIGASFGLAFLYKLAKHKGLQAKNALVGAFSRAAVGGGNFLGKATDVLDKGFMNFINYAGPPAIFLLLAKTLAESGFDKFSQYSGYYGTVGLALGACTAALAGAAYAYGMRGKQFKEFLTVFKNAFSLSSSSATMPYTKEALKNIGVREKIRESVVPLGATFNMMGTSLYLGLTAVCASMMLGHDPGIVEKLGVMATSIVTAFGAPGIPASSIAFMTPVLQQLHMTPEQMSAVFAMILLMDRPFDMAQTALNVTGDIMVAIDTEASAQGRGSKGLLSRIFNAIPGAPRAAEKITAGSQRLKERTLNLLPGTRETDEAEPAHKDDRTPPPSDFTPG